MIVDAMLCDGATVREGLLHILGGGASVLARSAFPSPLNLTLALLVQADPEELANPLGVSVNIVDEGSGERIGGAEIGWDVGDDLTTRLPGLHATIPLAIPLPMVLPGPSNYSANISIAGETARSIKFIAVEANSLQAVTPQPMTM